MVNFLTISNIKSVLRLIKELAERLMLYVKVFDDVALEEPIEITELKRRLPNVSLPLNPTDEDLVPFGYMCVEFTEPNISDIPIGMTLSASIPEVDSLTGKMKRTYTLKPMSLKEETIRMSNLRQQRNKLLQETDYLMTVDVFNNMTTEMQTAWTHYRQELRNLPNLPQLNFFNIPWPTKPE